MNWPQKRIGDYLNESKIESSDPSAERRIRVRLNAEGIEKRPLIAETEGATRYFKRRTGQFIYGKQNLHKGAFGVVPQELDGFESSSDLPAFDVADGLSPEWLEYFLKQGDFYKSLVSIARGAATKRIQPEALFAVELPIPEPDVQDRIIKRMDSCALEHSNLEHEITHQQSLLSKLKQAILQEAIQGKLTEDWRAAHPDVEPASQLLHRIQAEKARLIAEKKLRKEKSLPKITPEEIPFEIPKGWEWCRLGCLFHSLQYGTAQKCSYDSSKNTAVLRIPNVSTGKLSTEDLKYTNLTKAEKKQYSLKKHDVLMIRSNGSRSLVGSTIHFDEESGNYAYAGYLMRLRFPENIYSPFIVAALASRILREQIEVPLRTTVGINNVNSTEISRLKIPLPPLAEQAAIVERVEALMTTCRALEAEIEQSRTHAAHLLQAVLKEAFAPAAEAISHD